MIPLYARERRAHASLRNHGVVTAAPALREFERFRKQHPRAGEAIMRNLAQLLADRLIVANTKVDLLTSN